MVARYNDLASVDARSSGIEDEIAAIVVEPIAANMGFVAPAAGFLEGLRERARRWGALLIFDEVITWLRFGLEGAQGRVGVVPDLTAIGKIMGGGVPIAAFGGREDVMATLAPGGETFTGGTHGGNPFCVAMAHRVLDLLEGHPEYYAAMDADCRATRRRHSRHLGAARFAVCGRAAGIDRRFQIPRGPAEPRLRRRAQIGWAAYAGYYRAMLERGILLPPSQNEVMFVSTAHAQADIDETLTALEESLAAPS